MQHDSPADKAIVLVHGLTDSPYFMTAIAEHFFTELNYDIYIPLLQGHGLKIPSGMEGVSLEEWRKNVEFAIETAKKANPKQISIGGLSTGGTLSCHMAANHSDITGALYLFSAALDLAGASFGIGKVKLIDIGNIKEKLLRSFLNDLLDANGPLIGENPYRYGRMDYDGARELSKQIQEIDTLIQGLSPQIPFSKPVFAAHSESDTTADIQGIEALRMVSKLDQFRFFRIQQQDAVGHANLVLQASVKSKSGTVLEQYNPKFDEMMAAITDFENTIADQSYDEGRFQIQALRERFQGRDDVEAMATSHQQVLIDRDALIRYATLAQAAYTLDTAADAVQKVGCTLISSSTRDDVWFLDGLQAICATHTQDGATELIVAYRGTEKTNPADLIVDGGIVRTMISFTGDDMIRAVIEHDMVKKTIKNTAVSTAAKGLLAGRIANRLVNAMKYYQAQVESDDLNFDDYSQITIVGHSLGGVIAAHVAYWARKTYEQEIYCHTFNSAPGAKYSLVESADQCDPEIANRIINHRILGDSVSGPPDPLGTDEHGFPYGHIGYIFNWRPLVPDTLTSIAVHSLDRFIVDLECRTEHLIGVGPAPVGKFFW